MFRSMPPKNTHHYFKELFRKTFSRSPVLTPLTMAFDLKDETEVKDYIEKLGVEYRFGCYSEKNPEGNLITYYVFNFLSSSYHLCSIPIQYVIYSETTSKV